LSQQSAPGTGQPGAESYRGFEGNPVGRVDNAVRPSEDVEKLRESIRQQPGNPFSIEAIRESVTDLQHTGKFAQVQVSLEPHALLTKMGVPSVFDFVNNDDDRKVVELIISQTVFHRSYIAPPDTPQAQLDVLRAAFDKTVADAAFLADAEKLGLDIEPLSGAKVQDVVGKLYATPPTIVERARKAIRPD